MPTQTYDRADTAERVAALKRKEGYDVTGPDSVADGWGVTWETPARKLEEGSTERLKRELGQSWQEFDMRAALVHTTGRFEQLRDEAAVRYALASRAMIQAGLNPDPTALKLNEVDGPF